MYILTNYKKCEDGEGYTVAVPSGCISTGNFARIACGDVETGFALIRVIAVGADEITLPAEVVPDPLSSLMTAGEKYPPAIALARNAVEDPRDEPLSRAGFITRLSDRLQELLDDQPRSPFFLARCVKEISDEPAGSYCWVVGWRVRRDGKVALHWVSYYSFVYADLLDRFDVTMGQMTERFGAPEPYQPFKRGAVLR